MLLEREGTAPPKTPSRGQPDDRRPTEEPDDGETKWSDGTSWYEGHGNPSLPGRDFDTALQFGNEAPYFPIQPGRIYGGWIWCFADGDAQGADVTSAAYAQALIDATAKLIVVGQQ